VPSPAAAAARAQVRVAACQQLPALARCLGEGGLRRLLLEELRQLLEDEEVQVGAPFGGYTKGQIARAGGQGLGRR
jgi:hypothetical protein